MGQPIRVRWVCSACKKELELDLAGNLASERRAMIDSSDAYLRQEHKGSCSGNLKRTEH